MSAADIQVVTIIVPNPQFDQSKSAKIVDSDLGYAVSINGGFQTVSSNNPNNYNTIEGLLYLPTLDNSTANGVCATARSFIPPNVTTVASFPRNQNYPLTAVFPWTSNVDCTEAYLSQARADAVRGTITFQPNVGDPPAPADSSWFLRDGNSWKSDNQFPIYAINSNAAAVILGAMAQYSGNMTSVPNGAELAQQYDARDFPRLFAHVDLQGGTNVPSLWVFLIIVLAILLGIVIVASIIMHIVQRHQRRTLQRRLERGDVDLESLGIKKMNVPQELIDKMPKYIYTDSAAPAVPAAPSPAPKSEPAEQPHVTSFSQTTCSVCLDDFVSNETEVRELPCKHIFHPECIDLFLRDNSSLCPMCKQSALPAGYCPVKVTNLMVRRERLVRRMRERRRQGVAVAAARAAAEQRQPTTRAGHASSWLQRRLRVGQETPAAAPPPAPAPAPHIGETRRAQGDDEPAHGPADDVELGRIETEPQDMPLRRLDTRRQTMAIPAHIAAQGAAARRAWRRERLARQEEEAYNEQAAVTRNVDEGRPLWRRVAGRVVPGLD